MRERPISSVPKAALLLLALAFAVQLGWHYSRPPPIAKAENLPAVPSRLALNVSAFGDPVALAKMLMLYVQAFDSQPGFRLPYHKLDYQRLEAWLTRILELDPRGQYPLFAASRLYGEVREPVKQRAMFDFVYRQFLLDPDRRWPWLAHAAFVAKHGLKDLPLAHKYAQAIGQHATGAGVPSWAKQMDIFILEDMNELDSAKILLGGLLQSGQISDPHEVRFLKQRLQELEQKSRQKSGSNPPQESPSR
ncbi:hypothetical protein BH11PSE11_BH11PSE11_30700 [soil metagenome]